MRKLLLSFARWIVAFGLLLFPLCAQADASQYETWLGGFFNGPPYKNLLFQGDVHYRAFANGTPNWILVRPTVGYQIQPGMTLGLGYGWTPNWSKPNLPFSARTDEHRIFQQWQYEFPAFQGQLKLQFRSRLEERFRPRVNSDTGFRFRQLAKASIPLNDRFLLAAWDEIFFGLNKTGWGQNAGFDQNRAFLGVGYWLVPSNLRMELGYFNQYISRPRNADGNLMTHATMLNTYVSWK